MQDFTLFMLLLGAKPSGRHTEQHDIFFCIGKTLKECVPAISSFWPEAGRSLHIDAWRNVSLVNGFKVKVVPKQEDKNTPGAMKLFFINLGGYKAGEFEEYHYRQLIVAPDREMAIKDAKAAAFFARADSPHIDDKYGIDVDDIYNIEDILPAAVKAQYAIRLEPTTAGGPPDEIFLGYFKLDRL